MNYFYLWFTVVTLQFLSQTCVAQILYKPNYCFLGEPVAACYTNADCRPGYDCTTGPDGQRFCCPNEIFVCRLKKDVGSKCTNTTYPIRKFYYDVNTGSCKSYDYLGCSGNENKFDSEVACANFCVFRMCRYGAPIREGTSVKQCSVSSQCPATHTCENVQFGPSGRKICCSTARSACTSLPGVGYNCFVTTTSLLTERYYFNSATRTCVRMDFRGCSWTANHFRTLSDCTTQCLYATCPLGSALIGATGAAQTCTSAQACPAEYECFDGICCPKYMLSRVAPDQSVCNVYPDVGYACTSTTAEVGRWYYDSSRNQCSQFTYKGCGGNGNRWLTPGQCVEACVTKTTLNGICPGGVLAEVYPGTQNPRTCQLNVANDCPQGATCLRSLSLGRGVCCTVIPQCPRDLITVVIGISITPRVCTTGIACPIGSSCTPSTNVAGVNLCCTSQSSYYCPGGLETNFVSCSVNTFGQCPPGYTCLRAYEATTVAQTQGHCCRVQPKCVNSPYLSQVKVCSQLIGLVNQCDLGFVCETSSIPSISVCCPANDRSYCPTGTLPMIDPFTNNVKFCQPNILAAQCGLPGFSCVMAPTNPGQYICCSTVSGSAGIVNNCPGLLPTDGKSCRINPYRLEDRCTQAGFLCLPNAADTAPLGRCCQVSGLSCANSRQVALTPGGQAPHICGLNLQACTSGYACAASSVPGVAVCCSTTVAATSNGLTTFAPVVSLTQSPVTSVGSGITLSCENGALPLNELVTGQPQLCVLGQQPDACTLHAGAFACMPTRGDPTRIAACCPRLISGIAVTSSPTSGLSPVPTISTTPKQTNLMPKCSNGRNSLLQLNLPIRCPPGSTACPEGFTCLPTDWPDMHLCCEM